MTERHTDSTLSAVEIAFSEAIVDVTAEERDLEAFFEGVQSTQLDQNGTVLLRYCDLIGIAYVYGHLSHPQPVDESD